MATSQLPESATSDTASTTGSRSALGTVRPFGKTDPEAASADAMLDGSAFEREQESKTTLATVAHPLLKTPSAATVGTVGTVGRALSSG